MLIVLALSMLLMAVISPSARLIETARAEKRFFDLLLSDIYYMQSESYSSQQWIQLHFSEDGKTYFIQRNYSERLSERQLPETVTMDKASNLKTIRFSPAGSPAASGTMRFHTYDGGRNLVVYLGKGRVAIVE